MDIAASDSDLHYTGSTVAVFLNDGDGTFAQPVSHTVASPAGGAGSAGPEPPPPLRPSWTARA